MPVRPPGRLAWLHVSRAERLPAVLQLAQRLVAQRDNATVLLTAPDGVSGPRRLKAGIVWCRAPADNPVECQAFLAHFRPDICVWTSGDLRPHLIVKTADQSIPLVLVDASENGFDRLAPMGLPDPTRALLSEFDAIMASDANAVRRLTRLGLTEDAIAITGPLQEGSAALTYRQSDLDELADAIGPRPVWLSAMTQIEEAAIVLRAHRNAARYAMRLLLILVPDRPEMAAQMADFVKREGFRLAIWSEGEFPDDNTEVLLADTYGEMGLWYRLASISFMGSSLVSGHGGSDPFEPAALGSAILYGPNCGRHLHAYSRLVEAGAARIVRDADTLAAALKQMVAPDRAAAMSLAAWEVVSEGAEVSDRVTDMIHDVLDMMEAR